MHGCETQGSGSSITKCRGTFSFFILRLLSMYVRVENIESCTRLLIQRQKHLNTYPEYWRKWWKSVSNEKKWIYCALNWNENEKKSKRITTNGKTRKLKKVFGIAVLPFIAKIYIANGSKLNEHLAIRRVYFTLIMLS